MAFRCSNVDKSFRVYFVGMPECYWWEDPKGYECQLAAGGKKCRRVYIPSAISGTIQNGYERPLAAGGQIGAPR